MLFYATQWEAINHSNKSQFPVYLDFYYFKGLFINYVTETWEVGGLPCSHTRVLGAMRVGGGGLILRKLALHNL